MPPERNGRTRVRIERGIFRRITAHGETKYEVSYADGDGNQRWKTVDRLQEARALRASLVTKVASGEIVAPSKLTLGEYLDQWLAKQESRLRPHTFESYGSAVRLHVKPRLGRRKLQSVTVGDVAALIGSMQKGERFEVKDGVTIKVDGKPFAGWTIRAAVKVINLALGEAARDGVIAQNPVGRLLRRERPKTERRAFPELDKAAITKLVAATPEKYRSIVAVSVLTGLRQSESLGLVWGDVDLKARVIRVRRQLDRNMELVEPKTPAAKREIPLPPPLVALLKGMKEDAFAAGRAKPEDFVFASETGGPMHRRNMVRRGLDLALEATGTPHLTWHDLRHVAASALIAEGTDVVALSRMLGHANPAITLAIYVHSFGKVNRQVLLRKQMDKAFSGVLV